MQKYIKWKRVKVDDNFYKDINTNNAFQNETVDSEFIETPYEVDGYFLGIAIYPTDTPQEFIDGLLEEYSEFDVSILTETEANTFLANIGDITVADFIITDNRTFDDI